MTLTENVKCTVEQKSEMFCETHSAYGLAQAYNLSSKSLTQTHQLHYLALRTSFPDTFTSYRKTSVFFKLSNFTLVEFLTSPAKI